jgi:hypothetical protein
MPELDAMNPEMEPQQTDSTPSGETDREGAMAKADLYKVASYSHKLFKQLHDDDQLEAWVQAKITKAADYIASVYHYLEYEMKFSEYGKHLDSADTLSESEKSVIKDRLLEAKMKIKELKKAQAEKMQGKDKVKEGILSGGERPCTECGGTGMMYEEPKAIPDHVKGKVAKYNTMMKATKAAHKRMDANHNGIPDDEEVEEGTEHDSKDDFDNRAKKGDTYKTKSGGKVTKLNDKDDSKRHEKQYSDSFKGHGASKDKDLDEGKKAKKDYDQDGKIESGKDEYLGSKIRAAKKAGKMEEASGKCCCASKGKTKCPVHGKVEEASKPSAGLSAAKKSSVVKDAKAGKDLGKPGKSFDKVAAKAGGGEKGKKIAAAAMWKNIKEETAYVAERSKAAKPDFLDMDKDGDKKEPMKKAVADKKETVKESADMNRLRELMTRLNG